jgi:sorbitol/mannitol transport system substrate-binding protein
MSMQPLFLLTALWASVAVAGTMPAEKLVTLAAGERVPYIGAGLPENGYVAELAREAFKRSGYRVNINFYPWARAQRLAHDGTVDGVLPVFNRADDAGLLYSAPFPGDTIGLLKKKTLAFSYPASKPDNPQDFATTLKGYRIGVVLGGITLPWLEQAPFLFKDAVSTDLQNLDKLSKGRIQLALIDKYTAADLMASQRPQLIGQLEFLTPPLAQRPFYIGFSSRCGNSRELLGAFNKGLEQMARDGSLLNIQQKHGLFPPKKSPADKTELVIGTVDNSDMTIMAQLARDYERSHPTIRLDWRVLDENTLRLRLLSDLAIADKQFDIMTIGLYETPIWAKRGWLTPLHLPEDYDVGDLLPTVRAGLSYQNQLYALPFYAESSMTFYRKDLFARAGLSMPPQPDYQDILRFAARLHDPAHGTYGICLRGKAGWGENMALIGTMVNTFGGRWFNEQWQPELESPAWKQAVGLYLELLGKYGPPNAADAGFNELLAQFSQGHCAMWIDATVAAGILFDVHRSKVATELGYVPAPVAVTPKGAAWLWSWALAIPTSSRHKAEAADFIAWATSKGYIKSVAKNYGWVAVPPGTRASTYQNENYLKAAPFAQFVHNAIESADVKLSTLPPKPYLGIQYVGIPEFPAIGSWVGMEIANALRGKQTLMDALSNAQRKTNYQMKESGYLR